MPLIITYCIPLILAGLVQTMFSAADMAVLGAFDESADSAAVGAIGATGAIISLIVNSMIGFAGGTNVILLELLHHHLALHIHLLFVERDIAHTVGLHTESKLGIPAWQ